MFTKLSFNNGEAFPIIALDGSSLTWFSQYAIYQKVSGHNVIFFIIQGEAGVRGDSMISDFAEFNSGIILFAVL